MLYFGEEEILPGYYLRTYFDETTQRIVHEYIQDVEPITAFNLDMQKDFTSFRAMGDNFTFANIPQSLIDKWKYEEGFDYYKVPVEEVVKKLNDPDYKNLRTVPKRL